MHSLLHSVWHTQHQSKPHEALVQVMCMQPPARSVAVLHLGHGFVVSRMATADDGSEAREEGPSSAHREAREADDIEKGMEESEVDAVVAGSHSPMWKPCGFYHLHVY